MHVGGQQAVPPVLVLSQVLAVVQAIGNGHHRLKGKLGEVGCLASNDHGLHRELEKLIQHQVQEEHEGLQAGGVQADDAEL